MAKRAFIELSLIDRGIMDEYSVSYAPFAFLNIVRLVPYGFTHRPRFGVITTLAGPVGHFIF
ncbi:protein of unknown function [Serratia sp. Tan611]|nr:protein of unknown function [Serratia sp. Tan611]